jgi:septal ring-binding cell division protein DamX
MDNSYWNQDEKKLDTYNEKAPWWTSRPVLILFVALLVIGILSIVWHALLPNKHQGNVEVPYVKAETDALKTKPDHPGGAEIPHKDKQIYDLISDTPSVKPENETLVPVPEQPAIETKFDTPQELSTTPSSVAVEEVRPMEASEKEPLVIKEDEPAKEAKAPAPAKASGGFRLQLAALGSQKAAEGHIKILKKKYPTLKSLSLNVIKAKVKGKDYYRVQAGNFSTKAQALSACKDIKAKGGACNVVKN